MLTKQKIISAITTTATVALAVAGVLVPATPAIAGLSSGCTLETEWIAGTDQTNGVAISGGGSFVYANSDGLRKFTNDGGSEIWFQDASGSANWGDIVERPLNVHTVGLDENTIWTMNAATGILPSSVQTPPGTLARSIAMASDGLFYVLDETTSQIIVLDSAGAVQRQWDVPAGSKGMDIDAGDVVWVVSGGANAVGLDRYDRFGAFLGSSVVGGTGDPVDIAIGTGDNVWVSWILGDSEYGFTEANSTGASLRQHSDSGFRGSSRIAFDPSSQRLYLAKVDPAGSGNGTIAAFNCFIATAIGEIRAVSFGSNFGYFLVHDTWDFIQQMTSTPPHLVSHRFSVTNDTGTAIDVSADDADNVWVVYDNGDTRKYDPLGNLVASWSAGFTSGGIPPIASGSDSALAIALAAVVAGLGAGYYARARGN